ncbi:MAG TPA: DUF2905 family protein [Polyangiaceae bacterium]|nr:DUF2905 family protein [Polyangiaceae bacterium]
MTQFAKTLILLGAVLVLSGCVLLAVQKLGLGRLPGDFTWKGKHGSVHVPLASSLLLSLILTVLLNLWLKR